MSRCQPKPKIYAARPFPSAASSQSGLPAEARGQGLEAFTDIKYVCGDWA